ncbi:hypothetical protein EJ03DRAFT_347687 [Teratosphaeria nubilosa]|uniref:Uncharacterized protein n=1 Tax=Teratosphaeria nubilosa TaxID=161662 RepID=A0A6G1LMB5_9PEZI|nr:hypothetical protein EJ03DRAFT_347687 [Teratosphaeria nubilosa]
MLSGQHATSTAEQGGSDSIAVIHTASNATSTSSAADMATTSSSPLVYNNPTLTGSTSSDEETKPIASTNTLDSGVTSSSPAVYGGVALTYTVSTDTTRGPATLSPQTSSIDSTSPATTHEGSTDPGTQSISSIPQSTSPAAPYPLRDAVSPGHSTTTTTVSTENTAAFNAAQTSGTNPDPATTFQPAATDRQRSTSHPYPTLNPPQCSQSTAHPHTQPTYLPDIVTQQPQGASQTTSSAPQGITIVPLDLSSIVDPNNANKVTVTVTVTTTETDAGMTTTMTVAERTVTAGVS